MNKNQLCVKKIKILTIYIIDKMKETNMEESKHLMLEIQKKQNIPLFNNLYSRLLFQIQAETRKCS